MSNIRSIIILGGSPSVTIPRDFGFKKGDSVIVEKINENSCKITKIEYSKSKEFLEYVNKSSIDKASIIIDDWIKNDLKVALSNINVNIEKIKSVYRRLPYTNLHDFVDYKIYTNYHVYVITVCLPVDGLESIGVMGLLSTRRPLKGETYVRMSDISEGNLNIETLNFIKKDILENETYHEIEMKNNSIQYEDFELEPFEDVKYNTLIKDKE